VSELSGRLGALSADKRALLERALLDRRRAASQVISPRATAGPARLSATQHRLWFMDQLAPGVSTYNAIVAMWVTGEFDVDVLEQAVRASIERHEIVRTVITVEHDEPVQQPLDAWEFHVEQMAAAGDTAADRMTEAGRLAAAAARRPYDLAKDLMLRCVVIEVEPDRHLLAFCEHHIAFDGWSDEVFFGEVSEYYNAVRAGRPAPAPEPLGIQFADFAEWQQARLEAGALDGHAEYWAATLADAAPVLQLPLDRPRPDRQAYAGRHLPIDFDHAAGVKALRTRLGATDFMVLVAAWAATLYRWSGQSDIVLGTPMANRNRLELEGLIGFFSNTVPLRIRVDGAQSFADLVRQTTLAVVGAFDHQDLPFDRIVEAAAPVRDPRVNPLCQANVRVQSGPLPRLSLDHADVELAHIDMGFARFDIAVELQVDEDAIGGYLEYDEALFDEATALGVVARLDMVVGAVVADPDLSIWDIPQPAAGSARRRRGGSS
jgi:hypothetical protein